MVETDARAASAAIARGESFASSASSAPSASTQTRRHDGALRDDRAPLRRRAHRAATRRAARTAPGARARRRADPRTARARAPDRRSPGLVEKVSGAVVERAHAGRVQVRVRANAGRSTQRRATQREPPAHATAFHRKNTPPQRDPARRRHAAVFVPSRSGGPCRSRSRARAGSRSRPRSRRCRGARSAPPAAPCRARGRGRSRRLRRAAPATTSGGRSSNITAAPSITADAAIPYSTPGQRHAEQAEHSAERHHERERDGQHPDRRRAELRAPQPDRDHRQHVVEPRDRMREAGERSRSACARLRVRGRERSRQNEQHAARIAAPSISATPLDRPERAERADRVARQRLDPARPAHLEHAERALEREDQRDEAELAELDADVEADQRERQVAARQAAPR